MRARITSPLPQPTHQKILYETLLRSELPVIILVSVVEGVPLYIILLCVIHDVQYYYNTTMTLYLQHSIQCCTTVVVLIASAYSFLSFVLVSSTIQLGLMINLIIPNSSENDVTYKLFDFVNTIAQGVHVLEYAVLIFSFHVYCKKAREIESHHEKLKQEAKKALRKCFTATNLTVLLIFLVAYPIVIIVPPSLYKAWSEYQNKQEILSHMLTVSLFLAQISNCVIRMTMIVTTMVIKSAWHSASQIISSPENQEMKCSIANFDDLVQNYENTGNFVCLLQRIFQRWFVLQWIIYFIAITEQCLLIFNTLFVPEYQETNQEREKQLILLLSYLIFYISALAIPNFCGISINSYHEEYREVLLKKQREFLSQSNDQSVRIMQIADLIPVNRKYQFVPSFLGLSIPLNITGHTLTIILTLLAFVLSLVSKIDNGY